MARKDVLGNAADAIREALRELEAQKAALKQSLAVLEGTSPEPTPTLFQVEPSSANGTAEKMLPRLSPDSNRARVAQVLKSLPNTPILDVELWGRAKELGAYTASTDIKRIVYNIVTGLRDSGFPVRPVAGKPRHFVWDDNNEARG